MDEGRGKGIKPKRQSELWRFYDRGKSAELSHVNIALSLIVLIILISIIGFRYSIATVDIQVQSYNAGVIRPK